jgi:hypothetical protein
VFLLFLFFILLCHIEILSRDVSEYSSSSTVYNFNHRFSIVISDVGYCCRVSMIYFTLTLSCTTILLHCIRLWSWLSVLLIGIIGLSILVQFLVNDQEPMKVNSITITKQRSWIDRHQTWPKVALALEAQLALWSCIRMGKLALQVKKQVKSLTLGNSYSWDSSMLRPFLFFGGNLLSKIGCI